MKRRAVCCVVAAGLCLDWSALAYAEETKAPADSDALDRTKLIEKFKDQMNGVRLIGRFTVLGKDDGPLTKEEYVIQKVEKLPEGDKWLFHARIKYGNKDLAVPLPLDVKFAGDTGVITLSDMTIPGLGTFSSRVVIDDGKYAGTWRHGDAGGHLFGVIEKLSSDESKSEK